MKQGKHGRGRTVAAGGGKALAAPQLMAPLTTALLGCTFEASEDGTAPQSPVLPGLIVLRADTSVLKL